MILPKADPQATLDSAVETEQRFLCLFWLDPLRGQEITERLCLKPLDFIYPPHRHVFAHCLRCAVAGWAPTIRGALARIPTITPADLDGVLFAEGVKDVEFEFYAKDVQQFADDRLGDELRQLTRDTLKDFADYVSGKPRPQSRQQPDGPKPANAGRRYETKPTAQWRRIRSAS